MNEGIGDILSRLGSGLKKKRRFSIRNTPGDGKRAAGEARNQEKKARSAKTPEEMRQATRRARDAQKKVKRLR